MRSIKKIIELCDRYLLIGFFFLLEDQKLI